MGTGWRWVARGSLAVAVGAVVLAAVSGIGAGAGSATTESGAAADAVRRLADPAATAADLPADFAAVMGYRPVLVGAGAAAGLGRADGGCSSPLGGTAWGFTPACRQHDLGYDLLRYADRVGAPLGTWARRAVDDLFADRLRSRCEGAALDCTALAATYSGAVRANSVRQGEGVPRVETSADWGRAVAAGTAAGALLLLPLDRRPRTATRRAVAA